MSKITRETLRQMIAEEIARANKPEPEAVKVTAEQLRNIILQEVSKISDEADVITENATEGLSDDERAKVLRWFVDVGLADNMSIEDKKLVVRNSPEMKAIFKAIDLAGAPKGTVDVVAALKNAGNKPVNLGSEMLKGQQLNPKQLTSVLPKLPAVEKPKVSTKMMKMKDRGPVKIPKR